MSTSPFQAWLADDGRLETYQRIQRRPVFDGGHLLASFVATPSGETLFIGVCTVGGRSIAPPGMLDPLTGEDVSGLHLYDLASTDLLAPYRGKLVVDWGPGFRSWVQRADVRDKPILEIRRLISEPAFPGFLGFIERLSTLATLPASWRTALSSVSGVYILVCPTTGQRYVGSAYGAGGFWGRWEDYVPNGHGGNVGMRDLPGSDYQVAILEVAPSSAIGDVLDGLGRSERLLGDFSQWAGQEFTHAASPAELGEPVDVEAAAAALASIVVEPEVRRGYRRDEWPHWIDADGDYLNARDEVLVAESLEPTQLSSDGCDVVGGLWLDPYTGEQYRDPHTLDIDHLVPLQEAHDSGGHAWTRERRAAFANDLDDSGALIAVTREANRSKSAKNPEEWLPPRGSYRCRYVADWIAVKARWSLSMDESERVAVGNFLNACREQQVVSSHPGLR